MHAFARCFQPFSVLLPILLLFSTYGAKSQTVSISDATPCVKSDSIYVYTISGTSYDNQTPISWEVTGGVFDGLPSALASFNGSTSINNQIAPRVWVRWSGSATGSLKVTFIGASSTMLVAKYANALSPGSISNDIAPITYNTAPPEITSTALPSGGFCAPSYKYQWEMKSFGASSFSTIVGATGNSLSYGFPLIVNTYFRRKAIEVNSNSSAYSNECLITVKEDPLISGEVLTPDQIIPYNTAVPGDSLKISATSGEVVLLIGATIGNPLWMAALGQRFPMRILRTMHQES